MDHKYLLINKKERYLVGSRFFCLLNNVLSQIIFIYYRWMLEHKSKSISSQLGMIAPPSLFSPLDGLQDPEQAARNYLIQISGEEIQDVMLEKPAAHRNTRMGARISYRQVPKKELVKPEPEARISVAQHFTQSYNSWRKKSTRQLHQKSSILAQAEKPQIPNNFIIFQNGCLNGRTQSTHLSFGEALPRGPRAKPLGNILAFIRRKNLVSPTSRTSSDKKQVERSFSPGPRPSQSCQIKKDSKLSSPIQISTKNPEQSKNIKVTYINQTLRSRKMIEYIKSRGANFFKDISSMSTTFSGTATKII